MWGFVGPAPVTGHVDVTCIAIGDRCPRHDCRGGFKIFTRLMCVPHTIGQVNDAVVSEHVQQDTTQCLFHTKTILKKCPINN